MRSLVVFLAVCALGSASLVPLMPLVPLAQPPHHPAVVLDARGRPLDTAEVIAARALHLQAKHLEHAPLYQHAVPYHYHPLPAYQHLLKKRSLALAHVAYAAPVAKTYVGGSAVSHQSRVDVSSSPAVYAHAAPVYAHAAPVYAQAAPLVHAVPAAVSHQSRVDVHSSPAVYAHAAPVYAHAAPVYAHAAPVYAHAPAAVSHQSRVDVRASPVLSHAVHSHHAPLAYSSYSSPLLHAW